MSETKTKRFYWIKMEKDFFNQRFIKRIGLVPNGNELILLYLKLINSTVEDGGVIYFEGLSDSFVEEVALELDTDIKNADTLLEFLEKQKLIVKESDSKYVLVPMGWGIGSETEKAELMRKIRREQKENDCVSNKVTEDSNNVTNISKNVTLYREETEIETEINIETDKETDKETETAFKPPTLTQVQVYCDDNNYNTLLTRCNTLYCAFNTIS